MGSEIHLMKYGLRFVQIDRKLCLTLIFLMTISISLSSAYGESKQTVFLSHDNISVISYIPSSDEIIFEIELRNVGNDTAIIDSAYVSDLVLTQQASFSNLSSSISGATLIPQQNYPSTIPIDSSKKLSWTMNEFKTDEGTYSGRIFINGSNFDSTKINISIQYLVSPIFMLLFTFIGIGIALILGTYYEYHQVHGEKKKKFIKNFHLLAHITNHIRILNLQRNRYTRDNWLTIHSEISRKLPIIENILSNLELTYNPRSYEEFDLYLSSSIYSEKKSPNPYPNLDNSLIHYPKEQIFRKHFADEINNNDIPLEVSLRENIDLEQKISFMNQCVNKDNKLHVSLKRDKIAYLLTTTTLSIGLSLLVTDTFTGNLYANIAVAIATGFGVYRAKDIQNVFKFG